MLETLKHDKAIKIQQWHCNLEFFCRFLLSSSRDPDVKRWAAEGLSYLTLDADVKEFVVEDVTLIRALVELAKVKDFYWFAHM